MIKKTILISFIFICMFFLFGCQAITKDFGGETIITLDPGVKLEEITWKEDSLWYLTRPMQENEKAETHIFKQSSNFGVFSGTVTIIEQDK